MQLLHLKLPRAGIRAFFTKICLSALLLFFAGSVWSQQKKISGVVTSAKNSEPIPSVSVLISGKVRGTLTDDNGNFAITAQPSDELIFKAVGYQELKLKVGDQTEITVSLKSSEKALDEVVVTTALGIKRDRRSLGYATTNITGEQLTEAPASNWMDALSGKVPGLNLVRSNSGPGGSIKIMLRGENNLTDGAANEALIVVDGVVVNQGSGRRTGTNSGESAYGTSSDNMPADYGSNLNDINPEDIASVTLLKGPAAAALYGQRGANGAIMITTKSGGDKNKKIRVNFKSNANIEQINRWPDLQYEYGQGTGGANYYSYGATADGASTSSTSSAYGPKFDGQSFFQYNAGTQSADSVRTLWTPYTNKIRDYFNTGQTYTNSISLEGGTDKALTRFSVTNQHNKWIVPNTGYDRTSLAFSFNNKLSDKLQIATKFNYTFKKSDNLPGAGYGNQSIMYWFIFWQPNADIDWLKNYWENGKAQQSIKYPYSSYPQNPYAIAYEYLNGLKRHSITGNVQATYNFTKDLSLMVRTGMDFAYEQRSQQRPWDAGTKMPKGSYREQDIFSMEQNSDWLLRYSKKINSDFNITATAGGSALVNRYKRDEHRADSLFYPGVYSFSNALGIVTSTITKSNYNINSFYGLLSGSYKSSVYLDLSARRDWNSVLATPTRTDNVGFTYGSASSSVILSDLIKMPKAIDYAKLRLSAASVGSGLTTPYLTSFNYTTAGSLFSGGLQNPSLLANANLLPLRTITYELGTNVSLLNNRINVDVAFYTGNTKNQIISRIVDAASGYSSAKTNLSQINNKGLEVSINAMPIKLKNFSWSTIVNFSTNKNTVSGLEDSTIVLRTGPTGGTQILVKNGGSTSDLYGYGFQRSPDGQVIYDASTGVAKLTDVTGNLVKLGKTVPTGRVSWINDFTYKRLSLHLLFDAQYGAVGYSLTSYKLAEQGKTTNTLPGRYNGIVGNGVVDNGDGTYSKNTTIATNVDNFYRAMYGSNNGEGSTFSTDFIKFREASLYYSISPKALKKKGIQSLTFGIYGRDLFMWTKWPIFDPEFGTLSGTDIINGFEIAQFPSTRSFGASLSFGF